MKFNPARWLWALGLLVGCAVQGVATPSTTDGCEPFATRVCLCVPGPDQVQVCGPDGGGFGPCACTGVASDVRTSGNRADVGDGLDGLSVNRDGEVSGDEGSFPAPCPESCDDNNPCTADICEAGACVHKHLEVECDDGDPCTREDKCKGGVCEGEADPICIYAQDPDLASCQEGVLSLGQKQAALKAVNSIRALHGLQAVTYFADGDLHTQRAALIMAVNSALSHQPPADWACWTQEGFDGADSSNLHIEWSTKPINPVDPGDVVVGFLIDLNVQTLGHRRWVLDPFLKHIAFGGVHGANLVGGDFPFLYAAALQVIYEDDADLSAVISPGGVAYPVGEYPASYFDKTWYLSFSALVDTSSPWENEAVDLSGARVRMSDPAGAALEVYDLETNNNYFGLPNIVQWRAHGMVDGAQYQVVIDGIIHAGKALEYSYNFTLLP